MVNSINGVKFNQKQFEVISYGNDNNVVQLRHKKTGIVIDFNKDAQYTNARVLYAKGFVRLRDFATENSDMKVNVTGTNGSDCVLVKNSRVGNIDLGDGADTVFLDGSTFENVNIGSSVDEDGYTDYIMAYNSQVAEGKTGQLNANVVRCMDNIDEPFQNVTIEANSACINSSKIENVTINSNSACFNNAEIKNSTVNANCISLNSVDSENNSYTTTQGEPDSKSLFSSRYVTSTNDKIASKDLNFGKYTQITGIEINNK